MYNNPPAGFLKVWKSCSWVGSGALIPEEFGGVPLLSPEEGLIPNELRLRLAISKPYLTYVDYPGQDVGTDRNGGLGLYTFGTEGLQTVTDVNSVEEDNLVDIGVVPTRPETGYGYIQRGAALPGDRAYRVERFVDPTTTSNRFYRVVLPIQP